MALTPPCLAVHYTGHRITGRADSGFDPTAESVAAEAIAARLDGLQILGAFGSLASGADILFAEAFVARGVPLQVWLPFGIRRFQALSVRPAGLAWVARFDRLLAGARVTILRPRGVNEAAFAVCAKAAMCAAVAAAACAAAEPRQWAVWNGRPGEGSAGTAADIAMWRGLGLVTDIVASGGEGKEALLF